MNDTVRPAVHGDIADLVDLESMARDLMAEQRGGPAHLGESPRVERWSSSVDAGLVWVGELDSVVLGYLELSIAGEVALVRQVFVHPGARELGLGDGLLDAAMSEARRRGCRVLEGTALPGDRETKNLYERAGVTARKITVSKRL